MATVKSILAKVAKASKKKVAVKKPAAPAAKKKKRKVVGARSQNPHSLFSAFDATNIPNLDACDDDELLAFMEAVTTYTEPLMVSASEYAKHKLMAQRLRRHGDIQKAQEHEAICDFIYLNIPQAYRW